MQQRTSRQSRRSTSERLIREARDWTGFRGAVVASKGAAGHAFERLTQLLLKTQPE